MDILWKNLSTVCVVVDRDAARRPQSMMNTTSSPVMQASKMKGLVPRGAQLSAKSLCKMLVLVLQVCPSFPRVELGEGENFMILISCCSRKGKEQFRLGFHLSLVWRGMITNRSHPGILSMVG